MVSVLRVCGWIGGFVVLIVLIVLVSQISIVFVV